MIDKTKEPGISVKNIFSVDSHFTRKSKVSKNIKLNFEVQINESKISDTEYDLFFRFIVHGIDETIENEENSEQFNVNVAFVGQFREEGSPNMSIEEFIKGSAPAIMFPYIRNQIHTLTMNSGMAPVLLPPINIMKLISENNTGE